MSRGLIFMQQRYRQHAGKGIRFLSPALAAASLCVTMSAPAAAPPDPVPGRAMPASPSQRVLIASENSTYKDQLVSALVSRLRLRELDATVIDLAGLADINGADWGAIVMVHTWENDLPPTPVIDFLTRTPNARQVIDVVTSASGAEKIPGIDFITSASVMDEIPAQVSEIDSRIAVLLKPK
jgi:hypothetical protein